MQAEADARIGAINSLSNIQSAKATQLHRRVEVALVRRLVEDGSKIGGTWGSAIGTSIGGPVGAIGGGLGSIVGGLFG